MSKREAPEINAGSMADIAFLLLIFFLVSTTMDTDMGILKKLPEKFNETPPIDINERNILEININSNNDIMVEGIQISDISEIRQLALDFIDNGSGTDTAGNPCTWCGGKKDTNSSEHPDKAIIEIQSNRNSSYATYIAVQNAVLGAYAELRDRRALELYGSKYSELLADLEKNPADKKIRSRVAFIQSGYPQHMYDKDPVSR